MTTIIRVDNVVTVKKKRNFKQWKKQGLAEKKSCQKCDAFLVFLCLRAVKKRTGYRA